MNATKALELLEPIPSDQIITEYFTNTKDKCCSGGHLTRLTSDDPHNYSSRNCYPYPISDVWHFIRVDIKAFTKKYDLSRINNSNELKKYPQSTPKERVIALFKDMIKAGY